MMKKEFNLSEKMFSLQKLDNLPIKRRSEFLFKEDVKEFIRLLKEEAEKNVGFPTRALEGSHYPTRLKEGEVKDHDDWDCVDDAIEEGLVEDVGTGLNRAYKFTKLGKNAMAKLREFKQEGGQFSNFVFSREDEKSSSFSDNKAEGEND